MQRTWAQIVEKVLFTFHSSLCNVAFLSVGREGDFKSLNQGNTVSIESGILLILVNHSHKLVKK